MLRIPTLNVYQKCSVLILFFFILFCKPYICLADDEKDSDDDNGLCNGLLSLVSRPTAADSPCVVPNNHFLMEFGYGYATVKTGGYFHAFPQNVFRAGLPFNNEFIVDLPQYYIENPQPGSGLGPTFMGFKHRFISTDTWLVSAEGYVSPPSGGNMYGSDKTQALTDVMVDYALTSTIVVQGQVGLSTYVDPPQEGGRRYNSFNPIGVITWQPQKTWQVYAEVYGQTHTASYEGPGFNADAGVQYLVTKNIEVDVVYGHRVSGDLLGLENYVGAGFAVLI